MKHQILYLQLASPAADRGRHQQHPAVAAADPAVRNIVDLQAEAEKEMFASDADAADLARGAVFFCQVRRLHSWQQWIKLHTIPLRYCIYISSTALVPLQ